MTDCTQLSFELPGFCGRKVEGNFGGGNLSSDGGLVLLRQVDRLMGLTKEFGKAIARSTRSGQNRTFLAEPAAPAHLRLGAWLRRSQ